MERICRLAFIGALSLLYHNVAGAFPANSNNQANKVVGHGNYTSGYDAADVILGASAVSSTTLFVPADLAYDSTNQRLGDHLLPGDLMPLAPNQTESIDNPTGCAGGARGSGDSGGELVLLLLVAAVLIRRRSVGMF